MRKRSWISRIKGKWLSFKAYNPWAVSLERWFFIHLKVYMVVVLISSLIGWVRIQPVRAEFNAGSKRGYACTQIPQDDWVQLDCGGYYDQIVQKRDEQLHEMGCFLMGRWIVGDHGRPDAVYNYLVAPVICWKPTFTL
jgi:hypothetical protein